MDKILLALLPPTVVLYVSMITVDLKNAGPTAQKGDANARLLDIHKRIFNVDGTIENAWVDLPTKITADLKTIISTAKTIRENCDVMAVIGIGGSYLGAMAGIKMLKTPAGIPIEFLGTSFDPTPLNNFIKKYHDKRVAINVVSKSGTTLEISTAFEILQKNFPKASLYITTDATKGVLRDFATKNGILSFVVPNGVGGRYSVLSAVGLLPFAVAGVDIEKVIKGATEMRNTIIKQGTKAEAYKYALARYSMYTEQKKSVEVLVSFYDNLSGIGYWWQQLFGESEGKDGKGLFPATMLFSRDLHSMGQFLQQGSPVMFETAINVVNPPEDIKLKVGSINEINRACMQGTIKAHASSFPVIILNIDKIDAENFGALVYFFEIACASSAYLIGVNPFDQNGVETYKSNMKAILKR